MEGGGGGEKEGGPALKLSLGTCRAEGKGGDCHNSPSGAAGHPPQLLLFIQSGRKGAEVRQAGETEWTFCFIFRTCSFNSLIGSEELTGPVSWRDPWRGCEAGGSWLGCGGLGCLLGGGDGGSREGLLSLSYCPVTLPGGFWPPLPALYPVSVGRSGTSASCIRVHRRGNFNRFFSEWLEHELKSVKGFETEVSGLQHFFMR